MLEIGGVQLGTLFQGGTLLAILGMIAIWWIRGMPDRGRSVMKLDTDFTIGRVQRSETQLTLTPHGAPPRNVRDVIAKITANSSD